MACTCNAIGDIDRSTAPAFDVELRDAIDQAEEAIVGVDCSGVTFMDLAGFRVLVDATDFAMRRGHTLVVRNMSRPCARLVELCDIYGDLRIDAGQHDRSRVDRPVSVRADA